MKDLRLDELESLAFIVGSSLFESTYFSTCDTRKHDIEDVTIWFKILAFNAKKIIIVQRHKAIGENYIPPHLIKHEIIWKFLSVMKISSAISFCSVGTLQPDVYGLGSIIMPKDFFCPWKIVSSFDDMRGHCVPTISEKLLKLIQSCLKNSNIETVAEGIYANTLGPRFETKAEIKFLKDYATVVGMTGAHEATLATELNIELCMVCVVDNYAHGLEPENSDKLSLNQFKILQKNNVTKVEKILDSILRALKAPKPKYIFDLIISADFIVTVNESNEIIKDGAIAIRSGVIQQIGQKSEIYSWGLSKRYEHLKDSLLMPGLINCHTHSAMSYFRGVGSDLELDDWLNNVIWPLENALVSDDFVYNATKLAIAEMLLSGTTCFNDMYFFPEATVRAVRDTGIRAVVGAIAIDFPSAYAKNTLEYLEKGRRLIQSCTNGEKDSLITFAMACHSTYTLSEDSLKTCLKFAAELSLPLHIHLSESEAEVESCKKANHGLTPIALLNKLGFLTKDLIAVHMVSLSNEDFELFVGKDISVVHCPTSNLKLASGFCQTAKLCQITNLCIGTDGCASNNSLDMLAEMKLTSILGKAVAKSASVMTEADCLRMATHNGAKALKLEKKIGSIEVGKSADVVAMSLNKVNMQPLHDVVAQIVFSASRENVTHVWVNGRRLVNNRKLVTFNIEEVLATAKKYEKQVETVLKTNRKKDS